MNSKSLLIVWLAVFTLAAARPKNKILGTLGADSEPETKIREKRKYEIPILRQLEEGGVGTKSDAVPEASDATEVPRPPMTQDDAAAVDADGEPEDATGRLRVKKQSPNNIGGCGKTVCGPLVSARGPVVGDMRALLQGGKPMLSVGGLHPSMSSMSDINDAASKLDAFNPVQSRTVDTIVTPVTLGGLGYGSPAAYSAAPSALDLGHSFFKPPAMPTVPAVALITAPHQPSHSLIHPWLMPHLMPHLLPHLMPQLMSNIGSYFQPHRLEPTRFPDSIPTEIKQPAASFPPQPYYSSGPDNALLCQPLRNQRFDAPPYDFFYKPDVATAADKSINVTDGSKASQYDSDGEEERRIRDHLRKVNEIKDEISQLNRAAQRIVDQQERLTAMQQKQMFGGSGQGVMQTSGQTTPYMSNGYYSHPAMPFDYSRSNILSYPRSQDDIDFFINLLRAGKKMGLLSDSVQPSVLSAIGDVLKGSSDSGKSQKDVTDGAVPSDDSKVSKTDKKSIK